MEDYSERGWTDGLPVMPVTESYLAEFLEPDRPRSRTRCSWRCPTSTASCTVRTAAINAAMAGCRPEYFPVVLAAWSALEARGLRPAGDLAEHHRHRADAAGQRPGPRSGSDSTARGTCSGRAFAPTPRSAARSASTAINAFGLRPHELDQATQGNPAKYTACIAENEEQSPWAPFHVEHGFDAQASTVTAMTMRSVVHIEARHTTVPEQLALDIADTIRRTGALIHETISACIALGPEHAELFAHARLGQGRAAPLRLRACRQQP